MKTKTKLFLLILLFAISFIAPNITLAQGCFSGLISPPNHTEVQSANPILDFTMEPPVNPCNTTAGNPLTGIGMNQSNPQYMLDILCDPSSGTNNDINISTDSGPVNVGYRIGGNMFLWYGLMGYTEDVYCGVGAGTNEKAGQNVYMGNDAGTSDVYLLLITC